MMHFVLNVLVRWGRPFLVISSLGVALFIVSGCAVNGYAYLPENERQDVHRVQDYLNSVTSLKADFAQDGSGGGPQGDGRFLYKPGALRMDYEMPHNMVLVAHDERLVLDDSVTGSVTELSLKHHPLGFLLRRPLNFASEGVQVTDVRHGADSLQISLAQADNPSQGLLTLQFSDVHGRLSLVGVQGVDAHHRHFSLSLYDVQEADSVNDDAFTFPRDDD